MVQAGAGPGQAPPGAQRAVADEQRPVEVAEPAGLQVDQEEAGAGHAAPFRRRRGLAAPPRSPEVIVAGALAWGLPASSAAASSTSVPFEAQQPRFVCSPKIWFYENQPPPSAKLF